MSPVKHVHSLLKPEVSVTVMREDLPVFMWTFNELMYYPFDSRTLKFVDAVEFIR